MVNMSFGTQKSTTTPYLMPGQIQAGQQYLEDWQKRTGGWTPIRERGEGGIMPSQTLMEGAGKAAEMIGMGGFSPEEWMIRSAVMPYATGEQSFYDIQGLGEKTATYTGALTAKHQEDLKEAMKNLGYIQAAKGKYGSGGHFSAVQKAITEAADWEADMMTRMAQDTLQQQRGAGLAEAGERQQLLGQLSTTYGALPTMQRLGQLQDIATLPRQYAISDIDRQYQIWQQNMADMLNVLGQGVGGSSGGLGMLQSSTTTSSPWWQQVVNNVSNLATAGLGGYMAGQMFGGGGGYQPGMGPSQMTGSMGYDPFGVGTGAMPLGQMGPMQNYMNWWNTASPWQQGLAYGLGFNRPYGYGGSYYNYNPLY